MALSGVRAWFASARGSVSRWLVRFALATSGAGVSVGSAGLPAAPGYPTVNSMSTMARFPWVWTAVRAVASDLAGLPLIAVRRQNRSERRSTPTPVDDPVLDLLENPNPGCSGYLFRKQLLVDYSLTGNAYIYRPAGDVPALYRLHPNRVSPIPGPLGIPVGYKVRGDDGKTTTLAPGEVLHIRDISWSDDSSAILGESAIRCLHDDLTTELGGKELTAEQAFKGHPDVVIGVKSGAGPHKMKELEESWDKARSTRQSAFVINSKEGVEVHQLSWSPEQMQLTEGRAATREAVLAVFEVPPARAGLVTANYGTQKQQMRTYWEALIRKAKAFDDALSMLAGPGVRVEHDFTDIEALQVSYDARLARVAMWVALGATPAQAASYEGFIEAPVPNHGVEVDAKPSSGDDRVEEPQGDRRTLGLPVAIAGYLAEAYNRYAQIAEAKSSGADTSILEAWEAERLFGALEVAGVATQHARWWAEETVGTTVEAVTLADTDTEVADLEAFSLSRAHRLADRITRSMQEAA